MTHDSSQTTLVLGGGPAGLTAGYLLGQADRDALVFEADDQVGGIAKTVERDGYRFDLGGHRFFTKSVEVDALWHEVLGDEFLRRPRMSRIYWNNRYLDYPLRGADVIRKLGPVELTRCLASYTRAALRRNKVDDSLEDWVSNRFGRRLFELFFKSYTEKVWGVPTSEIRAEWAAQRIKGLSFISAAKAAFFGNGDNKVKSLISEFNYPRFGPGQMWEAMRGAIEEQGGEVRLEARVEGMELDGDRITSVLVGGETFENPAAVISSLPLREVVEMVSPAAPPEVLAAARGLRYRDFLTVALVLDGADPFPDNWIYIHEPGVQVGRIQNFRSWSPWMVPDPDKACVGLEYFCFAGDDLWTHGRRRARLACRSRAGAAPAGARLRGRPWVRDPRAEGLPDLRRRLRRTGRDDPRVARRDREPAAGRPKRPAPLQQLGSLDADRDARRRQRPHRRAPRHLGRQRRERLPRDRRARRASVPHRARDAGDAGAGDVTH